MFDDIAPYYDFLNRFLSLGIDQSWRRKALAQLDPEKSKVILDVATGTADLAIEMARRLQPEKVTGFDLSQQMLNLGQKKIETKKLDQTIELIQGDSEKMPFLDNTYDAVTVAFGVRNFENLEVGLKEMYRVLKTDGRVVVLEFSKPRIFPFKQLFNFYFKYILPTIGRFTSKNKRAYSYLYESVQVFPEGNDFLHILEKQGFKNNKCLPLTLGICSIYTGVK